MKKIKKFATITKRPRRRLEVVLLYTGTSTCRYSKYPRIASPAAAALDEAIILITTEAVTIDLGPPFCGEYLFYFYFSVPSRFGSLRQSTSRLHACHAVVVVVVGSLQSSCQNRLTPANEIVYPVITT